MKILNMTQHAATEEQLTAGVVEPNTQIKSCIQSALTIDKPSPKAINETTQVLVEIANDFAMETEVTGVLIGGAPWLMRRLEESLKDHGFVPVFAFSKRTSVEETLPNGDVIKKGVFKHESFIDSDGNKIC